MKRVMIFAHEKESCNFHLATFPNSRTNRASEMVHILPENAESRHSNGDLTLLTLRGYRPQATDLTS